MGAGRDPRACRLQAEHATAGGGDPDRAPGVVPVSGGHHPAGDGRARAAARAARGPRRIPRVPGRSVQAGLGGGAETQLRRVGPAQDDEPGPLEPSHQLAVDGRDVVSQEGAGLTERDPGFLDDEVLEQVRHARQGTVAERTRRSVAGPLVGTQDDRVDLRVEPLDAVDRGLDQLEGRHLLPAHQLGLGEGVELRQPVTIRHPSLLCSTGVVRGRRPPGRAPAQRYAALA